MNPTLTGDKRPTSGKGRGVTGMNYNKGHPNHMQEQSPNKMINQSQGSNMHPVTGEIHKKRQSHQPTHEGFRKDSRHQATREKA